MIKKILLSLFVVIIGAVLAAVYFLGPTMGAMFTGKAIFLGHDSPQRYGNAVLTLAETQAFMRTRKSSLAPKWKPRQPSNPLTRGTSSMSR